jgi:predicted dehydrogenase
VKLVAACDINPGATSAQERAQTRFHKDAGGSLGTEIWRGVPLFRSVEEMLAAERVDLLDVVVPDAAHCTVAVAGLRAGADVLIEKPFALSTAESTALISEARARERNIYVGQILRFEDRYRTVMDAIKTSGARLRNVSLSRNFQNTARNVYGRTHPFLSACVHDIDLAIWAFGRPPAKVAGFASAERGGLPDVVVGVLQWDSGAIATIQNSWHLSSACPYGFTFDSVFFTVGATYTIRNAPVVEIWSDAHGAASTEHFFWPIIGGAPKGAIVAQLTHYAECARRRALSNVITVEQAHAALGVAEALIESAHIGQPVEVRA